MASLIARPYRHEDAPAWDAFVERCPLGTPLHTRRFLAYHGERFLERSLVFERGDAWVGALPAASWPDQPSVVTSHPGATFGGLLTPKIGATRLSEELLELAARELRSRWAARRLEVRLPLAHLSAQPDESQLHALFRLGARLDRIDLWTTVHLDHAFKRTHRRNAKKGRKLGARSSFEAGAEPLAEFHALLRENLRTKHDRAPVHSREELMDLRERLGERQRLFVTRMPDGAMVAGTWLLRHRDDVEHTQYLASDARASAARPMEVMLDDLVEALTAEGARCLSLGASTEEGGRRLNDGLHGFKTKLGGGATAHYHASLALGD